MKALEHLLPAALLSIFVSALTVQALESGSITVFKTDNPYCSANKAKRNSQVTIVKIDFKSSFLTLGNCKRKSS